MDLIEIANEKLTSFVLNELKVYGIKCQKEKKKKYTQKKDTTRNIFSKHLHLLDLSDVILANGKAVKVPKFLTVACSRVLEQVETEGLFRKAGSIARQREIRESLEVGEQLHKTHHVIDVANVIKYFFRELPSPLISPYIQEALLQCLFVGENNIETMLLACLLLPPLALNTLCFFLQFLHTVSLSENRNKMTVQNLAIIFTPALMPFPNVKSQRFNNHVKTVRILIENSNSIGIIPSRIEVKLRETPNILSSQGYFNDTAQKSKNKATENNGQIPESTKKKRRSDIFHGLRKIVGSTMGSTELLDHSFEGHKIKLTVPKSEAKTNKIDQLIVCETSENKKRKYLETDSMFKTKKKETKKTRLSLGGERILKNITFNPVATSAERRWSIVGSSCSKNKNISSKKCIETSNCKFDSELNDKKEVDDKPNCQIGSSSSFLKDNNSEHEEIKESEKAIQSEISKEIISIQDPLPQNDSLFANTGRADHVQSQHKGMTTEIGTLSSPSTEQLVQCLTRKLHVGMSNNHCVNRSLSDRRTETFQQRSQDNMQNSSYHIQLLNRSPRHKKPFSELEFKKIQSQLKVPSHLNSSFGETTSSCNERLGEQWLPAEEFFTITQPKNLNCQENENVLNSMHFENFAATPVRIKINFDADKTPMLPPKSIPKKTSNIINLSGYVENPTSSTKLKRLAMLTPDIEEINGRASIARLREVNAGMVMAKAKLFDSLEIESCSRRTKSTEQNSARIQPAASHTPVSTSKQRHRNASNLPSKHLTKSIVNNGKLTKPCTVNYENGKKLSSKSETVKMFNNCHNTNSPRRSRK